MIGLICMYISNIYIILCKTAKYELLNIQNKDDVTLNSHQL